MPEFLHRDFGSDDVGTGIWKAIIQAASIQEAFETLLSEYDIEPAQLLARPGRFS